MPLQAYKVNILGVGISTINLDTTVYTISEWIEQHKREYVSVCTVHTIMECCRNEVMQAAVNGATMSAPDGMPLVWLAGVQSKQQVERVYGPDLMLEMCRISEERGYKQYFYGGKEGMPEELKDSLTRQFPKLQVVGTLSPPFRQLTETEDIEIATRINESSPDIIWVGLGTPKQDLWMARQRKRLNAPVLIAVGAAFDFHTGRVPQAPRWMQRSGLEWFFRLIQEPKRLWYRYLVYNPWFILLVLAQTLKLKNYDSYVKEI